MTTATYIVEVSWTGGTAFTGTTDNVTGKVLHAEWNRGRQFASQLTGKAPAGQAIIRLNNDGGTFSTRNANSPIAELMIPGRAVRIRTTAPLGTTLWRGVIDSIENQVSLQNDHVAILKCTGPLGYVNPVAVRVPMAIDQLTGAAIGTVLDQASWPAADRAIDTGQTTMTRFWVESKPALDVLRNIEASEAGYLGESKAGFIVFEDRQHRLKGSYLASQATYSDAAGAAISFTDIQQEDPIKVIYNDFSAEVRRYVTGTATSLWTLRDTGTNSPAIAYGGTFRVEAQFPFGNPTATIGAIAAASWTPLVATTDWNVFSDTAGTGTNLNANISVASSTYGQSMQITLTNTGTQSGFVTLLNVRGTALIEDNLSRMRAGDGSSQSLYGIRSYANPGQFVPSVAEAEDWAQFNLAIYGQPLQIERVTLNANRSSAEMNEVLTRDISDLVTISATGRSDLGFTGLFFIEAEHHQVNADKMHWVTYDISPATGYGGFWVIGTSELGSRTKPAY